MKVIRRAAVLAASVLSLVSGQAIACSATTPCINEVLVDPTGNVDAVAEYVELRFTPSAAIPAGTYLVAVEGDHQAGRNKGTIDTVIDVGGLSFGANGFLVVLPAGNTYTVHPDAATITSLSNGFAGLPDGRWSSSDGSGVMERVSTSYFLIEAPTRPTAGADLDTDNDGVLDANNWTAIHDSIGVSGPPPQSTTYAAINFRSSGAGTTGTNVITGFRAAYFGRFGDSFGQTADAWVLTADLGGNNPNWLLSATTSYPAGLVGKPLNHIGSTNNWFNLAPEVNIDPTATTDEDVPLTYAGNLSITDIDAGNSSLLVTITATDGAFSLSQTTGLAFSTGDGTGDALMTFTGTRNAINAALLNSVFTPTANFFGDASLTVFVDDQGATGSPLQPLTDEETQVITVGSVDDSPLVDDQSFDVSEDAAIGTSVGTVVASDVEGATLQYAFLGGQTAFAIDADSGEITTAEALDFETTPSYSIDVEVTDGTSTPTVATITIDVLNVNDNAPTIDAGQVFTIQENAPNGSAVSPGPVQADDADGDTLTYSFTTPNAAFAIIAATGQIVVANTQLIDFETTPTFTINVAVTDGTTSANADVTIEVQDVAAGDNAPVVHDQAFSIAANAPNGMVVGTVFAVDEDGDTLGYAFDPASADFAIDPVSGQITVLDNSNLATTPTFSLNVVVSDGTNSDNATITINVTGANEPPVVVDQTFSVAEDAVNGASVGQVVATDAESDPLSFAFDPASAVFAISASGAITVADASQLDFETTPSYTLTVDVTDGFSTSSATITIDVTDVDENDTTPPTVVSIDRTGANPATSSPVVFAVTFSETVNGVNSGDFVLVATGTVAGHAIDSLNCANDSCTVTVSVAEGNGTLGLNLVDDDSIVDGAGNPLGGTGVGNGDFTGQVFDIEIDGAGDTTPPAVVSVTRNNPSPSPGPTVAFTVTFTEDVTGVDATDFALTLTGSLASPAVSGVSGGGNVYVVTVSTGTGIGTIRLDVMDDDTVIDAAANALGGGGTGNGAFTTGQVYEIDTINGIPIFADGFEDPPSN